MPDDPNLFDDNDLLPDWLFGDGDSSDSGGDTGVGGDDSGWLDDRLASASPGQIPPAASGVRPPWETTPGTTSPTTERPVTTPPWQQHAASSHPGQAAPAVRPPWHTKPGPAPQPPAGGRATVSPAAPLPAAPFAAAPDQRISPGAGAAPGLDSVDFDWSAPSATTAAASAAAGASELPKGLTGMLPWRQTDQADASAGVPAADQDDAWLGGFEPASSAAAEPGLPVDDGDLDWLTGGAVSGTIEPGGIAAEPPPAPSADHEALWPEDDLFAAMSGDQDAEPVEPPAEVPPAAEEPVSPASLIRRLSNLTPAQQPPAEQEPVPAESAPPLSIDDLFPFDDDDFFAADEVADSAAAGAPYGEPEAAYEPEDTYAAQDAVEPEGDFESFSFDEEPPAIRAAAEPPPAAPGALPDWLTQTAAPPSSGAWEQATSAEPLAAEDEGELGGDMPDWLREEADFTSGSAAPQSYEDWERAEQEREREAAKTDEDRLLEQVPDWFASDQPPAPPTAEPVSLGTGPEFVPDWFVGLEEQNLEAAPDWFQQIDYTASPLAAPLEAAAPPPPDTSGDAVPDWFKADGALESTGSEADWAAVFGAPPPAGQPPAGQLPAEPPLAEPPLAEPPPAEPPVEPAASTWELDELPLPDAAAFLDSLDSGQPGSDDAWMSAFQPTDSSAYSPEVSQRAGLPLDDFVERFDPLELGQPAPIPAAGGDMDWLQDLSADDLVETRPEPLPTPLQAPETAPETPASEADMDRFLSEAMKSSQDIDSLLGLGSPGEVSTAPPVEEYPAVGVQSFEWSGADPWLDLEPTRTTALDLGSAVPGGQAEFTGEGALSSEGAPLGAEQVFPEGTPQAGSELPAAPRESQRPEWLEEMRPTDLPVTLTAGGARLDMTQKSLDELPDSVRALRDRLEGIQPGDEAEQAAPISESGPLAGIAGALPIIAEALPSIQRETQVEGLVITADEQKRIEKLQTLLDLLAAEEEEIDEEAHEKVASNAISPFDFGGEEETDEEAEAALEVKPRPRRRHPIRIDRLLIMLIMLAALIVPFVTDAVHFAADPPALGSDQQAVANAVEALEPDNYVLVALEYGPTAAGELDALAEAVLRDITAQKAVPLLISTNPVMAQHAEAVIAPLVKDARLLKARGDGEQALEINDDYRLLAYLPGDALGVRSLAQAAQEGTATHPAFEIDLRGAETYLPVRDVAADVALIVVVGEDSTAVRTWAEQLESLAVPKVALVTAAVEALTEPYVKADGYVGYLAGVRDTYSYNAARNSTTRQPYTVPEGITFDIPDTAESRWNSMALGAAVAAGLIALGMVVNMVRALGRRRRR